MITELAKLSKTCQFGALENEMIRDRIVVGIRKMRVNERLLNYSPPQQALSHRAVTRLASGYAVKRPIRFQEEEVEHLK